MNDDQGVTHIQVYNILYFITLDTQTVPHASCVSSDRGYRISRVCTYLSFFFSFFFVLERNCGSHRGRSARSERSECFRNDSPALGFDMILHPTRLSKNIHKLRTKSTWNSQNHNLFDVRIIAVRSLASPSISFFGANRHEYSDRTESGSRTLPNDSSAQ